ncbi:glycosyltransferase family 2 protein [Parapedobacter sp. DT-150]|uniref:glycosyltransferase family 2 protein n=1 Tax=Parapedobacter sp. DT-150 TaxID=3396162 RepID=UPI003F1BE391
MAPKVSIITVTFNCEKTIAATIESIVNQTYDNIEYIVVDGKSTDNTLAVIDQYKEHITVIVSEKDMGIYDAMNKGVTKSTGDFVNFMNAGDIFRDVNIIETLFNTQQIHKHTEILIGDAVAKFNGFTKIYRAKSPSRWNPMPFNHQASFVTRDLLCRYPFSLQYKFCADRDFFIRAFLGGAKFKVVKKEIAVIDAIGYSSTHAYQSALESLDILLKNNSIGKDEYYFRKLMLCMKEFVRSLIPKRFMNSIYKITK